MPVARIAVSGMPARISQITEICEIVLENSDDWNLSEDADWEREAQQICNRFSQPSRPLALVEFPNATRIPAPKKP